MSAVLNLKPVARPVSRPSLTVVQGQRPGVLPRVQGRLGFALMVVVGCLSIALLNLGLNLATSTGVYQVAGLKAEKARLDLNTQILAQQVDSLSSNQNLASAAQAMGMVSNANPVFLDVNSHKVVGDATAASSNVASRVSGNLIANAQWTTRSDAGQIRSALASEQAKATASVATSVATATAPTVSKTKPVAVTSISSNAEAGYVGGAKSSAPQVGLANSGIPTAPTH
jgi:hypothetical protein